MRSLTLSSVAIPFSLRLTALSAWFAPVAPPYPEVPGREKTDDAKNQAPPAEDVKVRTSGTGTSRDPGAGR